MFLLPIIHSTSYRIVIREVHSFQSKAIRGINTE